MAGASSFLRPLAALNLRIMSIAISSSHPGCPKTQLVWWEMKRVLFLRLEPGLPGLPGVPGLLGEHPFSTMFLDMVF
jgi:hypothetical protein